MDDRRQPSIEAARLLRLLRSQPEQRITKAELQRGLDCNERILRELISELRDLEYAVVASSTAAGYRLVESPAGDGLGEIDRLISELHARELTLHGTASAMQRARDRVAGAPTDAAQGSLFPLAPPRDPREAA